MNNFGIYPIIGGASLSILCGIAGIGGAASAQTVVVPASPAAQVVIAPTAPPEARVEVIPPAPSSTVFWQPGYWSWSGTGWVWHRGHYEARPRPAAVWVPGQWQPAQGGGYSWVEGHWQ